MKKVFILLVSLFPAMLIAQNNSSPLTYPPARKEAVEDTYFGNTIKDPYRWLEADTSAEVKAWVEAQNKLTFGYLDKIPFRESIRKRLTAIFNYERYGAPLHAGKYYIYSKNDGLQNQAVNYIQEGLTGTPKVLMDPNKMSADGTAAISLLDDSHDHQYMAYAINQSGSDWQTIKVKRLSDANDTGDNLEWVKFSGAAWYKDGFYYSRYPEPGKGTELSGKNEQHQVWFHKMGTAQKEDKLTFEDAANPQRYYTAQTTDDERYIFIYVSQGTYGTEILYRELNHPEAPFRILFKGFDYEFGIIDNVNSVIYVSTNYGAANNRVISVDLSQFDPSKPLDGQFKTVVPEQPFLLESATAAGGKLFLNYLKDVSSHVQVYSYQGVKENEVELPALGTATGFAGDKDDKEVFFTFTSFTYPAAIYRYTINTKTTTLFRSSDVKFNPQDYVTEQVFYPSMDGTKIPMFLTYKKGLVRNGKNPALLYAYGGFNVNMTPAFSASRLVLLENGGVYAVANIRGGGEYGDAWHKAGILDKKQNVFDDFIAAAEYLQEEKYTSPAYTAVQGGSNGGLLIGAVINQRPELYKVAFPAVGVMDMLRFHKFTVGWGWKVEYGSSDSSTQFKNLLAYSPLHNIRDQKYPATLVTTADHDDRVVPAHSFKYIATLQQHQQGPDPVLIRVDVKAGHGAGKPLSKTIDELTDIYSFMFYSMGLTVK